MMPAWRAVRDGCGHAAGRGNANITFHGVLVQDDGDRTRALAALLGQHTLRPVISHVLPLAAAEAHRIIEGGHAGGKIVLDVAGSLCP